MALPEDTDAIVFIIDDDPRVRDSLESLLQSIGQASAAYATAQAFLDAARPDLPACLVLDVRLPEQGGLDLQRALVAQGLHLPVIVITGHGDIPMAVAAMKAGAIDFLTKSFRDQDLIDAIQRGIRLDRAHRAGCAALRAGPRDGIGAARAGRPGDRARGGDDARRSARVARERKSIERGRRAGVGGEGHGGVRPPCRRVGDG